MDILPPNKQELQDKTVETRLHAVGDRKVMGYVLELNVATKDVHRACFYWFGYHYGALAAEMHIKAEELVDVSEA